MANVLENAWNAVIGSNVTSSTQTTVTDKPSTNYGLLIGGVVLAILVIGGIIIITGKAKKD